MITCARCWACRRGGRETGATGGLIPRGSRPLTALLSSRDRAAQRTKKNLERIERAGRLWDAAVDPRGTIVENYLASRALTLDDGVAGTVLRYHPQCPWRDENTGSTVYVPALVAAFTSIDDGSVTAIQRVALTADGRKIGRRMLGIVHRAAVKLDHLANGTLSVGEGVETCMAGRALGHAPVWATAASA